MAASNEGSKTSLQQHQVCFDSAVFHKAFFFKVLISQKILIGNNFKSLQYAQWNIL